MKKIFLLALMVIASGCTEAAKTTNGHSEPLVFTSPDYPELKKDATFGILVRAVLNKEGRNENCQIVSSQNPHLNETALQMCRESKFQLSNPNYQSLVGHSRLMRFQFRMAD